MIVVIIITLLLLLLLESIIIRGRQHLHLSEISFSHGLVFNVSSSEMYSLYGKIFVPCENIDNLELSIKS